MMFASSFSLPSLPAAPRGSVGAVPPAAGAQLPSAPAPGSAPLDRGTGSCPWTRAGLCWEGKSLLLCNCYFGAQTSAGKGNISVVITGTSFSEFLGAQILLLTAWGGGPAASRCSSLIAAEPRPAGPLCRGGCG